MPSAHVLSFQPYGLVQDTVLARSSPAIDGVACARATAAVTSSAPSSAAARMQPFCAPPSRRMRVSRRVSMSAMPTTRLLSRYAPSVPAARQFEHNRGRSRMTSPATYGKVRFRILGIHAHVADVRIRERDDLAGVRRIGEDLLVAGHRGVEHHFADGRSERADRPAVEHRPIGQSQHRRRDWRKKHARRGTRVGGDGFGHGRTCGLPCGAGRGARTCEAGTPPVEDRSRFEVTNCTGNRPGRRGPAGQYAAEKPPST